MVKYALKSCCCGCASLRSGTIFSGVAAIVLSVIGIIVVALIRVNLKTIIFDVNPTLARIIVIVNLIMTIILSSVMLVGVVKRKWFFMAPWVALGIMLAIGLLVSIILNSVNYYRDGDTLGGTLLIVLGLLSLVVYCYMWYVCLSFFLHLVDEANRGAYTKDPFRRQRI